MAFMFLTPREPVARGVSLVRRADAVELSLSAAGATPQGHGVAVRFASPVGARTGPDDI